MDMDKKVAPREQIVLMVTSLFFPPPRQCFFFPTSRIMSLSIIWGVKTEEERNKEKERKREKWMERKREGKKDCSWRFQSLSLQLHSRLEMQSAKLNHALHDAKLHYSQSCILSEKEKCNSASCNASFLALSPKMQFTVMKVVRLTCNFHQNLSILPKLLKNISGNIVKVIGKWVLYD